MRLFKQSMSILVVMLLSFQICAWAYIPHPQSLTSKNSEWNIPESPDDIERDLLASFLSTHNINSLDEYVQWFTQNMDYLPDTGTDTWSPPLVTLIRGGGDCEDLAFLNVAVLKHLGISARVLGTKKDSNHHVFTIFEHENRMFVFDNNQLIKTRATNLAQIAVFLYEKYKLDYILEVRLKPRQIRVLFDKATLQKITQLMIQQQRG